MIAFKGMVTYTTLFEVVLFKQEGIQVNLQSLWSDIIALK
jgi:hypothetical protein